MHLSQSLSLPAAIQSNRIGTMGCCFMKLDFVGHCKMSSQIGVSYVETFAFKLNPEVMPASEAKQLLADNKLELLLMIAENLDLSDPDSYLQTLDEHIQYWKNVGLTTFVTLRGSRSNDFDGFLKLLEKAGELVRKHGLMPLTQNHAGGMVESPDELAACKAAGVGLHFDTQQFHNASHDARAAWEQLCADVVHVHLADRYVDKTSAEFGKGDIGLESLLKRIHGTGYRGAITLEPELADQDESSRPHVQNAFDFCKTVLAPLDALGTTAAGHSVHNKDDIPAVKADWGQLHWVGSGALIDNCDQTVGFVTIKPGQCNPAHFHPEDQEVIVIRSGTCRHMCGDHEVRLNAGDVLFVPEGQPHQAINDGDENCEMLVLYPTGARGFKKVKQLINA